MEGGRNLTITTCGEVNISHCLETVHMHVIHIHVHVLVYLDNLYQRVHKVESVEQTVLCV